MGSPPCIIRPAHTSEAEVLSELALNSKAYWGYSKAFMDACRDELTYTAEQIGAQGFQFAVAEVAGACVGFYALAQRSPDEVELEALFVKPSHIGRGIGRALMEHAKGKAAERGARSMIIQGDPNAEGFYRAAGGLLIGERESASIGGRSLPLFRVDLGGVLHNTPLHADAGPDGLVSSRPRR